MRAMIDVTCGRCGITESCSGVDSGATDLALAHCCPDGVRHRPIHTFTVGHRTVPGPGERGRDDEGPR